MQECPTSGVLNAEAIALAPRPQRKSKSTEALKRCNDDPHIIAAVAQLFWNDRKVPRPHILPTSHPTSAGFAFARPQSPDTPIDRLLCEIFVALVRGRTMLTGTRATACLLQGCQAAHAAARVAGCVLTWPTDGWRLWGGQVDKARSWFSRAVLLDPDNGDFWALYYKFEAVRSLPFHIGTRPPSLPPLRARRQLKLRHPRLVMPPVVHRHAWVTHPGPRMVPPAPSAVAQRSQRCPCPRCLSSQKLSAHNDCAQL